MPSLSRLASDIEDEIQMKTIILTHGKVAIVSDRDYPKLWKYKWFLSKTKKHGIGYAIRKMPGRGGKAVFMHRQILNAPPNTQVDHKNGNALDNRRCNLRLATPHQNSCNRAMSKNNRCGFKGVYWNGRKWVATIHPNRKALYLGQFDTKERAARAYNKSARNYYGPFAKLNRLS